LRNQYLQTEQERLTAENQRFAAELETLRMSIAATAAETIVAIAAATAAGVAEGTARAAASAADMEDNVAIDAAGAVGGAAAVVAAVNTNTNDDPGTHDDETPKRKRNKTLFFNPPKTHYGRLSDWKDCNDNCGGSRV